MFPYSLQRVLQDHSDSHSDSDSEQSHDQQQTQTQPQPSQNSAKTNWFHAYQVPAEPPKPSEKPARSISSSMSKVVTLTVDWQPVIKNWFHCYQVPAEQPKQTENGA
mmetsp:Transcript_55148/g.87982  ORF Transcript_55148/g.87982 Transcript_55148/m.87982 type:complete len:107 (+) Transcript_55148:94-414(+)